MINKKNSLFQITICLCYFFVFWNLALCSKYTVKDNIVFICIKTILLDVSFIVMFILTIKNYKEKLAFSKQIEYFKENKWFFLFIAIFVLSLISITDIWLMGDGAIYYSQVIINRSWNFQNIFDLKMVGHQTCFYTIWLLIGEYILPSGAVGVRLILIFLATITVCMFYGILKKIYTKSNCINLILFVAIFAFHPGFWGILGELNTDFPVLIFFVWVLYFQINKQYILMCFSAIMLCFSKETGVMILAFYTLGCLSVKIVQSLKEGLKKTVKQIFALEMLPIYCAGLLWLLVWIICSRGQTWSGGSGSLSANDNGITGIKLDTFNSCLDYMVHKLEEILILNNGYIFFAFAIMAIIFGVFTKKKLAVNGGNMHIMVGIYIAFIGFLNFNLYFVTWPNYRYLMPLVLFSTFCASLFILGYIRRIVVQRIIILIVLCIVILSNFRADPISRKIFNTVSMGNGEMISTNLFYIEDLENKILGENKDISYEYAYDDEGVYNREYSYRGKCINKILKNIKYDSNTLVVFPYITGSKSFYYGRREGFEYEKMYVNNDTYKLSINYLDCDLSGSSKWTMFNAIYLNEGEQITSTLLDNYSRVYYIYPLITGKNKVDFEKQINGFNPKDDFKVIKCTTGFRVLQLK